MPSCTASPTPISSCGAVADILLPYDDGLDERAGEESGFAVDAHSLVFEGLCPACQQGRAATD